VDSITTVAAGTVYMGCEMTNEGRWSGTVVALAAVAMEPESIGAWRTIQKWIRRCGGWKVAARKGIEPITGGVSMVRWGDIPGLLQLAMSTVRENAAIVSWA
jgi:hypothetical protein